MTIQVNLVIQWKPDVTSQVVKYKLSRVYIACRGLYISLYLYVFITHRGFYQPVTTNTINKLLEKSLTVDSIRINKPENVYLVFRLSLAPLNIHIRGRTVDL